MTAIMMQQTIAALLTTAFSGFEVRAWGKASSLGQRWRWKDRSAPRPLAMNVQVAVSSVVKAMELPGALAVRVSPVQRVRHVSAHGADQTGEAFTGVVVYFRHPDHEEHVMIIDAEDEDG